MRVIDCIRNTDSHWQHNGETVFVFQRPMTGVEKMAEIVRLTMEIEKLKSPVDMMV